MQYLEDLQKENIKIYQDDELYRFTSDAVILSRFAKAKCNDNVADFCAGCGIVGFNFYAENIKLVNSVSFFEMQTPLYNLIEKSIEYNGLKDKFFAHNKKIQDIDNSFNEKFSLILCNPPYMEVKHGFSDKDYSVSVCRTEIELPLEELIKAVSKCLKFGGRVCMCHRADRLAQVIIKMHEYSLQPKRLQLVSAQNKKPYLFLIEAVKGGKSGLDILNTLEN